MSTGRKRGPCAARCVSEARPDAHRCSASRCFRRAASTRSIAAHCRSMKPRVCAWSTTAAMNCIARSRWCRTCGGVWRRCGMRCGMRCGDGTCGQRGRAEPRVAGAPVSSLARQPARAASPAAPPRPHRVATPYRRHPRRSVMLLSVEEASQLVEEAAAAGRPLKKSPIDLSARAVNCSSSFSSSSSPSPRPRSRCARPAATAGAAPAHAERQPGHGGGVLADELGAETTSGGAVGRRTRSATSPAASRSTPPPAAAADLGGDGRDIVARRDAGGGRKARGAAPDGGALRRGRRRVVPLERDADPHGGVDFASLIVRNSSARRARAAPRRPPRKRPLDMAAALSPENCGGGSRGCGEDNERRKSRVAARASSREPRLAPTGPSRGRFTRHLGYTSASPGRFGHGIDASSTLRRTSWVAAPRRCVRAMRPSPPRRSSARSRRRRRWRRSRSARALQLAEGARGEEARAELARVPLGLQQRDERGERAAGARGARRTCRGRKGRRSRLPASVPENTWRGGCTRIPYSQGRHFDAWI